MEIFFGTAGLRLKDPALGFMPKYKKKSRGDKKGKNTQKRLKPNILTSICLSLDAFILVYFSVYSSLLLTQLLY